MPDRRESERIPRDVETKLSRRPRPRDQDRRLLGWSVLATTLAIFAAVYFLFLVPPGFRIRTAGRAEILAAHPHRLLIFRYRHDPRIVVLDFPSLKLEGEMLNRLAALIGKAGLPRDRVLGNSELAAAIRASGATPESFASGHAYRAADLALFFRLMAQDGVPADPEERRLRALLATLRWFRPGAVGALASLPGPGLAAGPEAAGRAAILAHELAEGAYFTVPAYDVYAHRFFENVLDAQDRAAIRRYLASRGYDALREDLLVNETQAMLMFPSDPSAAVPGLAPARVAALRAIFWRGIPLAWLKSSIPAPP